MSDESRPRWALILGASSGFGAATARALADDGFHICGVHLDRRSTMPLAEEVIQDIESRGVQCRFFNVNAADATKRAEVLDALQAQFQEDGGHLVVLFHSLAFGSLLRFVPEDDGGGSVVSEKQMSMTLDVMANSLVYWTQGVVQRDLMERGGRVFAMTSTGSHEVSPSYGVVSGAKAALEAHCRQLAYELLSRGITVNSICAGVTDTAALRKIPGHDNLIRKSLEKSPIDRLTHPEDVGGAVAALCDQRLYWLTGNCLGLHGGEDIIG
ncbi:MAG: 3-oxoacyl-ACP reductase [Deltaproteobacteria bacterium]|nr:3-oxoacyl-ACP reductase [Deltaproteobacteria bacterium]